MGVWKLIFLTGFGANCSRLSPLEASLFYSLILFIPNDFVRKVMKIKEDDDEEEEEEE